MQLLIDKVEALEARVKQLEESLITILSEEPVFVDEEEQAIAAADAYMADHRARVELLRKRR